MRIWVFSLSFNEAALVPFFLRHYAFAERIVIADNESADGTPDLLRAAGVEVVPNESSGLFSEWSLMTQRNNRWKMAKGKADWAVIVDFDEFLYWDFTAPDGISVAIPNGEDIFAERFPDPQFPIEEQVTVIGENPNYSKPCAIRPDLVDEIHFAPGQHAIQFCSPPAAVMRDAGVLRHYRHLGREYHISRNRSRGVRMDPVNAAKGWAHHYYQTDEETGRQFDEIARKFSP